MQKQQTDCDGLSLCTLYFHKMPQRLLIQSQRQFKGSVNFMHTQSYVHLHSLYTASVSGMCLLITVITTTVSTAV